MPPPLLRLPDATWISRHAPTWPEDVTLRSDLGDGQAQTQTYPRSLLVYARPTAGCGRARPTRNCREEVGSRTTWMTSRRLVGTDISSPWAQPMTAQATRVDDRPVLARALAADGRPAAPNPAGRSTCGGA